MSSLAYFAFFLQVDGLSLPVLLAPLSSPNRTQVRETLRTVIRGLRQIYESIGRHDVIDDAPAERQSPPPTASAPAVRRSPTPAVAAPTQYRSPTPAVAAPTQYRSPTPAVAASSAVGSPLDDGGSWVRKAEEARATLAMLEAFFTDYKNKSN